MVKLDLSVSDILQLIEICGKSHVKTLKLGKDIELAFEEKANSSNVPVIAEANAVLEQAIEKESFAKAEADVRKSRLEAMILEDPSKFEGLLVSGDLIDDETTEN